MRMKACDSRAGLRLAVADRLCVEEKNVLLGETHTGPSGAASDATSHSGWSSFLHYGTTLLFVVVDDVLEGLMILRPNIVAVRGVREHALAATMDSGFDTLDFENHWRGAAPHLLDYEHRGKLDEGDLATSKFRPACNLPTLHHPTTEQ